MYRTTLYAQPKSLKPYKVVTYRPYEDYDKKVNIPITNIGAVLLELLKGKDDLELSLTHLDRKSGNYDLIMNAKDFTVAFGLRNVHQGKEAKDLVPEHHYIIMQFEGDRLEVHNIIKNLYSKLGEDVYRIAIFDVFSEITGIESPEEIKDRWLTEVNYDFKKEIAKRMAIIKKIEAKGRSMGIDMNDISKICHNAEKLIENNRYSEGLSLLDLAKNAGIEKIYRFEQEHAEYQGIRQRVKYIGELIKKFKDDGFNTKNVETLFTHVLEDINANELKPALEKCNIIENMIKRERFLYRSLEDRLNSLEKKIIEAKVLGVRDEAIEAMINRGRLMLNERNYHETERILDTITKKLEAERKKKQMLLSQFQLAKQAINEANIRLIEAKRYGIPVDELDMDLSKAKIMLVANEYAKAIELAENAGKMADMAVENYKRAKELLEEVITAIDNAKNYIAVENFEDTLKIVDDLMDSGSYVEAVETLERCKSELEKTLNEYRPKIAVTIQSKRFYSGQWNRCTLILKNTGNAHAINITLKIEGNIDVMKVPKLDKLNAGDSEAIDIGLKSSEPGDIPIDITVSYGWLKDDTIFQAKGTKWLSFIKPGAELLERLESGQTIESATMLEGEDAKSVMDPRDIVDRFEPSQCYIIYSRNKNMVFHILKILSLKGKRTLCITRTFPKKIIKRFGIDDQVCKILWLTKENVNEGAIRPTDLEKLSHEIKYFLDTGTQSTVIFEGLEYLTTHNKFESVLKLIQSITDRIAMRDGVLLVPIDKGAIGKDRVRMLEREFDDVIEV